jgi:hypothetical protein
MVHLLVLRFEWLLYGKDYYLSIQRVLYYIMSSSKRKATGCGCLSNFTISAVMIS